MGSTYVPVQEETRDRLRAEKVGGETYDDVVNRLLEERGDLEAKLIDLVEFGELGDVSDVPEPLDAETVWDLMDRAEGGDDDE